MLQFVVLAGSLLTALEVKDLGIVFALVGATGATVVSFTLPGAAYYAMHKDEKRGSWKNYGAVALVVTGCILTPVCLVFIFL